MPRTVTDSVTSGPFFRTTERGTFWPIPSRNETSTDCSVGADIVREYAPTGRRAIRKSAEGARGGLPLALERRRHDLHGRSRNRIAGFVPHRAADLPGRLRLRECERGEQRQHQEDENLLRHTDSSCLRPAISSSARDRGSRLPSPVRESGRGTARRSRRTHAPRARCRFEPSAVGRNTTAPPLDAAELQTASARGRANMHCATDVPGI